MSTNPRPTLVAEIVATLRVRYGSLNLHYEAAWTDSWTFRRCWHEHLTLVEAAKCGIPQGAGFYVFAIENGTPRELTEPEETIVKNVRFGRHAAHA